MSSKEFKKENPPQLSPNQQFRVDAMKALRQKYPDAFKTGETPRGIKYLHTTGQKIIVLTPLCLFAIEDIRKIKDDLPTWIQRIAEQLSFQNGLPDPNYAESQDSQLHTITTHSAARGFTYEVRFSALDITRPENRQFAKKIFAGPGQSQDAPATFSLRQILDDL